MNSYCQLIFLILLFASIFIFSRVQALNNSTLPVRSITKQQQQVPQWQINEYENNAKNAPKIDFFYTGAIPQPPGKRINHLIIGGQRSAQKQFPWQAQMKIEWAWLCGGSLISELYVLTAAHCLEGSNVVVVYLGGINRSTNEELKEITVISNNLIVHSAYNSRKISNDIALIRFDQPVSFNDYVNVIRLPRISDANKTFVGGRVVATGYGASSENSTANSLNLNSVELSVIKNIDCVRYYGQDLVNGGIVCASGDKMRSPCFGDSGGPLVYPDVDGWIQIGIVSFGAAKCLQKPAVFTRVTSHAGWISSKTNIRLRD